MATSDPPRLYSDLAAWWPLPSPPEDYAEEAAFFQRVLAARRAAAGDVQVTYVPADRAES